MSEDPRYPVGKFEYRSPSTDAQRSAFIQTIADTPGRLRDALRGLTASQLDTPYRDGGWTVRQVAHHLPDSHMNGFTRFKLALTEDGPTIKPYDETRWAELGDVRGTPVETSVNLLDALHQRWVVLLRSMGGGDWERTYMHPEHGRTFTLDNALGLYDWHCRHHVAHITTLRQRKGW
jgi:hypothetical protein